MADSPSSQVFPSYALRANAGTKQSVLAKLMEQRAMKQVRLNGGGRRSIPASFRYPMQLVSFQPASKIMVTDQRAARCHAPVSYHMGDMGSYFLLMLQDTESRRLMTDW
jgi:hypothetical protein